MLAADMADTTPRSLRVLTVGSRYRSADGADDAPGWAALVAALQARGDTVRVLTTDEDGPELDGVDRSLHWFRAPDGGWRRPARLEASRISRHGLLQLGTTLQRLKPHVVVWTALGGLPLTLAGASGLPELALVLDPWPVYGPAVDLKARQDGWDPGGVAAWSCGSGALRAQVLTALDGAPGGGLDPGRVHVDDPADRAAWIAAILGRIDALARPDGVAAPGAG